MTVYPRHQRYHAPVLLFAAIPANQMAAEASLGTKKACQLSRTFYRVALAGHAPFKEQFGAFSAGNAAGLWLRHDHGSVYMSDDSQNEIRFLGIEPSPAFVRQPEGNGCIERFFRTLKEQLLWIRHFRDLEELRAALIEFRNR